MNLYEPPNIFQAQVSKQLKSVRASLRSVRR